MKEDAFNELLASVREAAKISRGEAEPSRVRKVESVDVKAIRERSKRSQDSFASMLGVSTATLRNWEQGRRRPDGAAVSLLRLFSADPDYCERILRPQPL